MKKDHNGKSPLRWTIIGLTVLVSGGLAYRLSGQTTNNTPPPPSSAIFSPAHTSLGQAAKEFFGIRLAPVQPIAYTHKVHAGDLKMDCKDCHEGVDKGPIAKIPTIDKCLGCHADLPDLAKEKPEVQKILDYAARGEDIPWQRVYGFPPMSHVRFNHAPHIRNKVDCAVCHGDIRSMTVARKVVDHTMGFCVKCHEQRKASNDCLTCHY